MSSVESSDRIRKAKESIAQSLEERLGIRDGHFIELREELVQKIREIAMLEDRFKIETEIANLIEEEICRVIYEVPESIMGGELSANRLKDQF